MRSPGTLLLSVSFALILISFPFVEKGKAQNTPTDSMEIIPVEPARPATALPQDDRIFGIMPNYQTVSDPNQKVVPLTKKQKFELFVRETTDPFTFVSAGLGAAMSQHGNDNPKYGNGFAPYMQRVGAATADLTTQNFFSDFVLASAFHEDPRYYRMGPGHSVMRRAAHAMSRLVITQTDSGNKTFNFSGVLGMGMGIALSNAYYPDRSVGGHEVGSRFVTSMTGASLGNLLPEFWPDIKQKFFRHKNAPLKD
jgi:hypothetical protein